ncbi:hypothetical protein DPMN_049337 [Dreissena polymorpha]|uniref:Uncharacterized protein n=1 Tax=Dreissena polymorpha TaxID=45954 RepID=A0A9D4CFI8_DREPO|nr:hypothetical protein DPMN_049337 [Dreissena polymorpha]
MRAVWPTLGLYDRELIQSLQYLMDSAHDFRKGKQAYCIVAKGKMIHLQFTIQSNTLFDAFVVL